MMSSAISLFVIPILSNVEVTLTVKLKHVFSIKKITNIQTSHQQTEPINRKAGRIPVMVDFLYV